MYSGEKYMAVTKGNLYGNTARFYDLEERKDCGELSFYLERASKLSGDILEIACGTGRITLPLAQAVFRYGELIYPNICYIYLKKSYTHCLMKFRRMFIFNKQV